MPLKRVGAPLTCGLAIKSGEKLRAGRSAFRGAALGKEQGEVFFGRSLSKIEGGKRVIESKQTESSITQTLAVNLNDLSLTSARVIRRRTESFVGYLIGHLGEAKLCLSCLAHRPRYGT